MSKYWKNGNKNNRPYAEIYYEEGIEKYYLYMWFENEWYDYMQDSFEICLGQAKDDFGISEKNWEDVTNTDYVGIMIRRVD